MKMKDFSHETLDFTEIFRLVKVDRWTTSSGKVKEFCQNFRLDINSEEEETFRYFLSPEFNEYHPNVEEVEQFLKNQVAEKVRQLEDRYELADITTCPRGFDEVGSQTPVRLYLVSLPCKRGVYLDIYVGVKYKGDQS